MGRVLWNSMSVGLMVIIFALIFWALDSKFGPASDRWDVLGLLMLTGGCFLLCVMILDTALGFAFKQEQAHQRIMVVPLTAAQVVLVMTGIFLATWEIRDHWTDVLKFVLGFGILLAIGFLWRGLVSVLKKRRS